MVSEIRQSWKDKYCYDFTSMRYLDQPKAQKQKVEQLFSGLRGEKNGSYCLLDMVSFSYGEKRMCACKYKMLCPNASSLEERPTFLFTTATFQEDTHLFGTLVQDFTVFSLQDGDFVIAFMGKQLDVKKRERHKVILKVALASVGSHDKTRKFRMDLPKTGSINQSLC